MSRPGRNWRPNTSRSKGSKTKDVSACRLAPGSQVRVGGGPRGRGVDRRSGEEGSGSRLPGGGQHLGRVVLGPAWL